MKGTTNEMGKDKAKLTRQYLKGKICKVTFMKY